MNVFATGPTFVLSSTSEISLVMKTCIKQVQKITQLAAFLLTAFSLRAQETHNTLDHRINVLFGLTQPDR